MPGVIQGIPGAPVLCSDVVLFASFAAGVHFDVPGPVLYMGGDSVRTGLPLLVSSHAGDCGGCY